MFWGALGLDGHTGCHSSGLGRQEGEKGNSRKRSGPNFGRATLPQRAASDFRLWLCEPMTAIPVPTARFHRESAYSQAQAACEGLFWGGEMSSDCLFVLTFIDLSCLQCLRMAFVACILKNVLLVLDPFCVCEIAILY